MTSACSKRGQVSNGDPLAIELSDQLAATKNESAMADFLHLGKIGGDQKDCTTELVRNPQIAIDFCFGTDIHANGRLFENQQASVRFHPSRDNHFLLIAAA